MQVILDSPFARPGSAPMWGAGRKESSGTGLIVSQLGTSHVRNISHHINFTHQTVPANREEMMQLPWP